MGVVHARPTGRSPAIVGAGRDVAQGPFPMVVAEARAVVAAIPVRTTGRVAVLQIAVLAAPPVLAHAGSGTKGTDTLAVFATVGTTFRLATVSGPTVQTRAQHARATTAVAAAVHRATADRTVGTAFKPGVALAFAAVVPITRIDAGPMIVAIVQSTAQWFATRGARPTRTAHAPVRQALALATAVVGAQTDAARRSSIGVITFTDILFLSTGVGVTSRSGSVQHAFALPVGTTVRAIVQVPRSGVAIGARPFGVTFAAKGGGRGRGRVRGGCLTTLAVGTGEIGYGPHGGDRAGTVATAIVRAVGGVQFQQRGGQRVGCVGPEGGVVGPERRGGEDRHHRQENGGRVEHSVGGRGVKGDKDDKDG
jgi:hypothetical protein